MKIKVLGTSFNINSYKDEDYSSVVLIEGSLMAITGKKETVIKPNYLLKCDNLTQAISVKEVDVQEYISWKDGWLLCNQENIEHVMSKLSKYYDIKIDAGDRRIKTMTISGKLELKDNYEEVLNIICKTAPLQYRRSADRIIMSAKGQKLN
jgi:ferric-dicitrate binding protein FerR (iron transport regulator)